MILHFAIIFLWIWVMGIILMILTDLRSTTLIILTIILTHIPELLFILTIIITIVFILLITTIILHTIIVIIRHFITYQNLVLPVITADRDNIIFAFTMLIRIAGPRVHHQRPQHLYALLNRNQPQQGLEVL